MNMPNTESLTEAAQTYRGVLRVPRKVGDRYVAILRVKGTRITSAYFETPEEAARAYDRLVYENRKGKVPVYNFPEEDPSEHPLQPSIPSHLRSPLFYRLIHESLLAGEDLPAIVNRLSETSHRNRFGKLYTKKEVAKYILRHDGLRKLYRPGFSTLSTDRVQRQERERVNRQAILRLLQKGLSLTAIAGELNNEGLVTKLGASFTISSLFRIIDRDATLSAAYLNHKEKKYGRL